MLLQYGLTFYTKDKLIAFHLNWIAFLIFRRENNHYSYLYCFFFRFFLSSTSVFISISEHYNVNVYRCVLQSRFRKWHSTNWKLKLHLSAVAQLNRSHWNGRYSLFQLVINFRPTMTEILQNIYFLCLSLCCLRTLPPITVRQVSMHSVAVADGVNSEWIHSFQVWNMVVLQSAQ